MNNKFEYRSYSTEFRMDGASRRVTGLAIPVESRSQLLSGAFYETISRNAVTEQTILTNDVRLLVDHEPMRGSLGRSKYGQGTLRLFVDDRGLNFEIDLPDTPFGNETLDAVKRGDIDSLSFAFVTGKDEWSKNTDGTFERRINDIEKLIEISLLDIAPAYTATEVSMRSLEDYKRSLEEEEEDPEKKTEEEEDPNKEEKTDCEDPNKEEKSDCEDPNKEEKSDCEDPNKEEKSEDEEDTKKEEEINERLNALKLEFEELAKI